MSRFEQTLIDTARCSGIDLVGGARVWWLTVFGHREPAIASEAPAAALETLDRIFARLGGDIDRLLTKRAGASPKPDARLGAGGRIVEIDESQHFTSDRLLTLEMYPEGVELGFNLTEYAALCDRWRVDADRYRVAKATREFARPGGRRAQRAYFDACRDLLAPHLDKGPVIRLPAPERDVHGALGRLQTVAKVAGDA